MNLRHATLVSIVAIALPLFAACGAPRDGTAGAGERVAATSEAVVSCAGANIVQGVDVSVYQGSIDWNAVHASGRGFAVARVSDGTTNPDSTFATNWAGIKAAGMVRGVYQFFRASEDPTAQADLLVNAVGALGPGDLPPVADVELMDGQSGATLVANLATWISVVKAKLGRTPMIYSSPGFWNALPSTGQFAGEVNWVANWGVSCPDTATPWTSWSLWQYADNGSVAGISGAVDLDEFNGTLAELQALCGPAPYAAQYVSQSFPLAATALTMAEGQTIPSYIELKNVGTATWDSKTRLGTTQPRDRASVFADSSWPQVDRPAAVTGTVPPGATYKFAFNLHAPSKVGTYFEYFGVVQEGVAWFSDPGQGGPVDDDLEVQVKVIAGPAIPPDDAGPHAAADGGAGASDDGGAPLAPAPGTGPGTGGSASDDGGGAAPGADDGGSNAASGSGGAGGCSFAKGPSRPGGWTAVAGALLALAFIRRRRSRALLG